MELGILQRAMVVMNARVGVCFMRLQEAQSGESRDEELIHKRKAEFQAACEEQSQIAGMDADGAQRLIDRYSTSEVKPSTAAVVS